jgi:anti-sigma B factor antagonist
LDSAAGGHMPAIAKPTLVLQDGVTIVRFDPPVKTITEDILMATRDPVLETAEHPGARVVIDLKGVEFFSSSFIELIFQLWKRLRAKGGDFALCNLHKYCRDVIHITNLDKVWSICDTREQAIAKVNAPPPAE